MMSTSAVSLTHEICCNNHHTTSHFSPFSLILLCLLCLLCLLHFIYFIYSTGYRLQISLPLVPSGEAGYPDSLSQNTLTLTGYRN